MEITGLAIGIVGIAGLFTTCVDFFDKIVTVKALGQDYQIIHTQLRSHKHLFEEWGKRVGLQDPTRPNPDLQPESNKFTLVYDILATIEQLSGDCQRLKEKYGLNLPSREPPSAQESRKNLQQTKDIIKKTTSMTRKAIWAVQDKRKFEDLVSLLGAFVAQLYEIVIPVDNAAAELNEALERLRLSVEGM